MIVLAHVTVLALCYNNYSILIHTIHRHTVFTIFSFIQEKYYHIYNITYLQFTNHINIINYSIDGSCVQWCVTLCSYSAHGEFIDCAAPGGAQLTHIKGQIGKFSCLLIVTCCKVLKNLKLRVLQYAHESVTRIAAVLRIEITK